MNIVLSAIGGYAIGWLIVKLRDIHLKRQIDAYKAKQREWWSAKHPNSPIPSWMV